MISHMLGIVRLRLDCKITVTYLQLQINETFKDDFLRNELHICQLGCFKENEF